MSAVARRLAFAFGAFVLATIAAALAAQVFFGSGNILVWMIASAFGIATYVVLAWQDRRAA